jgi:hypothetical protein
MSVDLYDAINSSYGNNKSINKLKSQGYNLDSMLSNRNNKVFYNPETKKVILGIKGTNPYSLRDIGTDAYLAVGKLDKTDRYKESKRILEDAKRKYEGYQNNIIGHSLGGSIASRIANKNDKVYSYNEGVSPFQKTRSYNGNHQHIRSQIDPVSILGANAKHMQTKTNVNNPTGILPIDLLKSHNLSSLKSYNIKI